MSWSYSFSKFQILMKKHALQNGCFLNSFVIFTSNHVGWLILLLIGVGWDIMGYESETPTSYHELRNCFYSIKLSYTPSLSTLRVHLYSSLRIIVDDRLY